MAGRGHIYHDKVTSTDVVVERLELKGVDFDAIKAQVRFRTDANIPNLATGAPLAPDGSGIPTNIGDRILVDAQTNKTQQGLYRVVVPGSGSDGQWVRDTDMLAGSQTTRGLLVFINEGVSAGLLYYLDSIENPVVGLHQLPFTRFTGGIVVPTSPRRTIQFSVSGSSGAGTIDSVATIPAGNQVFSVDVETEVAFDGGSVLDIGNTATPNLIFDKTQADLTSLDVYGVDQTTAWPISSVVRATLGGAPTVGTAKITVVYGAVDA